MKKGAKSEVKKMGPLKVAHLNGLSISRQPVHSEIKDEPERASNDERVWHLKRMFEFVSDFLCEWDLFKLYALHLDSWRTFFGGYMFLFRALKHN